MTASRVRLGAVGYLNARPLVYGLERQPRFELRYDIPSECARLLHAHDIDVGLIPSIEYLRGPQPYMFVPGPAVISRGAVASVAIYTRVEPRDIRSIAMDTSSRTSVALATVMLRRAYGVRPDAVPMAPDLESMLAQADAALIIGDTALLLDHTKVGLPLSSPDGVGGTGRPDTTDVAAPVDLSATDSSAVRKIDLGELWTQTTGLPFVYAAWAGWTGALRPDDVRALRQARDEGVADSDAVARAYYPDDPEREAVARRYLRDNIRYFLGDEELDGLRTFYRYAAEERLVPSAGELRFFSEQA